jgi:hypothetical protein
MARRLNKTLLDYLIIGISPALIMLLVHSLVQFLILVFYRGSFEGRLGFVMTMFVIGAVLIARISIDEGRERAMLFAPFLAGAILLAINRFVQFHGMLAAFSFFVNCGLIALVWWSSDRLTWDCTVIDEQEEDSGEGLLETVGLDRPDHAAVRREIEPARPVEIEATTSRDHVPTNWWDRFVERRHRPHAPGVWVVYFSLAALPLFGLGQLFIPTSDVANRQTAFRLLFIYTASGLGLLLSTSFLGLRRYLRQRKQEMPLKMVNLWLGIGAGLIVGVMFLALLLPRRNAEFAISQVPIDIGSPDQNASPNAVGSEGVEEERPDAQQETREDAPPEAPQSDQTGKSTSADGKKSSDDGRKSSKDSQKSSKDSRKSPEKGKDGDDQKGKDGGDQKGRSSDDPSRKAGETGETRSAKDQEKSAKEPQEDRKSDKKSKSTDSSGTAKVEPPKHNTKKPPSGGKTGALPRKPLLPHVSLPPGTSAFAAMLKWIFYAALAAVLAYFLWKNRVEILEALRNFRQALADLWNRLFGAKPSLAEEAAKEEIAKGPSWRRFADFRDPFAAGAAARYRPEELVRYTFEALEAWARDNGHPRLPEQTPHEFARSVGVTLSSLTDDARHLADLYCQVAYAPGSLQAANVARLPHLWQEMRAAP